MAPPAPVFGRASLGLVTIDNPTWALRRGLVCVLDPALGSDLPAVGP